MYRQKAFFEIAKSKLALNLRLVDIVSDILNLSTDSAYRRIRGEKELTLSELAQLCNHFDISMDSILNYKSDNAIFKYVPLELDNLDVYCIYMENLAQLYESLIKVKDKSIIATAQDILIFHFLPFTELTFFKLYVWNQSLSKEHPVAYEDFLKILDKERLEAIYCRITDAYNQIPSTEVWSKDTIEPILSSIEYFYDMACFKRKENIHLICHQVLQLIENVSKLAEIGEKEYKGHKYIFNMYLCPVPMENNFLVTTRDKIKTTSVKLYTINGIITSNSLFCNETEKWINSLVSKSINFTGASARERFKFFQQLRNKVNYLIEKVNNNT